MRIGLFVGEFPHPAAAGVIEHVVQLRARGLDARIVAERPTCMRVEHEELRAHRLLEHTVYRDATRSTFDVVHAEGLAAANEAIRQRAAGELDGAIVVSLPRLGERDDVSTIVRDADGIVVRTHHLAERLLRRGARAAVLPPLLGITAAPRWRRRPHRPRRLLTVGTLDDARRARDAIAAIAERRSAEIVLDIAGDGSARAGLEQLAARLDVAERVRFHGWCSTHRVRALLGAADLFVLFGGDAMGLREAQAAGLPVVATADAEVAEVVRHGDTGLLVPADDVGATTHAIEWTLEDEPAHRRMSRLAQLLAPRGAIDPFIDLYREAMRARARPPHPT
jgi:glycosyltransferase involved in cell wall biosynthesis